MNTRTSPGEVHGWFREYFRERPDIGVWKAALDLILAPRNPFEPERRRLPKPGFVIGAAIATAAAACFTFFNFVR